MLKAFVDSLDGLDDSVKGFYEEKDGKYRLKVEGLDDGSQLKEALQKERENSKKLEADISAMRAKQKQDEMKKAEGNNDIEAIKKQMKEAHDEETAGLRNEISGLKANLSQTQIDNVAIDAISKENGISDLLMPFVKNRTRLSEDGKVEVLDDKGQLMVNKDGENLGVIDLVKNLKSDPKYAGAFQGSAHSGGGMPSGEAAGSGAQEKTSLEKIQSGLQKRMSGN